ncbi:progranulin isoform X3 [Callorhinchus milii]|uniref:progranulin isoform X3 n=1 Tax=Callorhinchus milii TaxID=7868 RepID=UPI001C3F7CB9|nr:progranulin isoform X3 [Callorhinchus milii]
MFQAVVILWLATGWAAAHPCPDGSECLDEETCCKSGVETYACCPMPDAVCCSDELHCCPANTTCDLVHSACIQGFNLVSWVKKMPANYPATTKAVCCGDEQHCCPEGFRCETGGNSCIKISGENEKAVICPDGASECPDGSTCCLLPNDQWGCCPLEKAVCCNDRLHCCPFQTKCDLKMSKCLFPYGLVDMWEKVPARRRFSLTNVGDQDVRCSSTASCSAGHTCCQLPSGRFGCCPSPEAVCCADHRHCCPTGSTCDTQAETCQMKGSSIPWLTKVQATVRGNVELDVQCDGTVSCPTGATCCRASSGGWSCCPLPQAVCCEDHIHCCPTGHTCNLTKGTCDVPGFPIPWFTKNPATVKDNEALSVMCDEIASCPSGTTCCRKPSGYWGCCPMPEAVCCEDHIHCCPNGYTCETRTETCQQQIPPIPWVSKFPATVRRIEDEMADVQCDGTVSCPTGATCCRASSGGWSCCPLPQAVCCEDHIHCCPTGHTCNLTKGTCDVPGFPIPWFTKNPATVKDNEALRVMCDETASCPSGTTCCRKPSGYWGCCPMPEAVCCEDHIHCCPNGYTCETRTETCQQQIPPIPWVSKFPATVRRIEDEMADVQCDGTVSCPTGATCCRASSGGWSCCPLPQAVCCEDHIHCCPTGHTCNLTKGTCDVPGFPIPWFTKNPATVKDNEALRVMCDETASCPSGTTCCRKPSGYWGCCPMPEAVCCEDHIHCCPNGYTCETRTETCQQQIPPIPWVSKFPATVRRIEDEMADVQCDGTVSCPTGATCCRASSGGWSCCPLPQAVCCEDHLHCCPTGHTCNLKKGTCDVPGFPIPWFTKNPATLKDNKALNVMCDKTASCPSGTTCCRKPSGYWGCCPVPEAVCCVDHVHCCPRGLTCSDMKCEGNGETLPWLTKIPATEKLSAPGIKCDEKTICPPENTCCKQSSAEWSCCPLPQAVCCGDRFCCPQGYVCDGALRECVKKPRLNWNLLISKHKKTFGTL